MADKDEKPAEAASASSEIKSELPIVESPPLDPATPQAEPVAAQPEITITPAPAETKAAPDATPVTPRFVLTRRQRRTATLAASLALAACFGGVVGAFTGGGFTAPPARSTDTAALEERKALQRSVAHLNREIAALKATQTSKAATSTQVAKITDKITERFERAADEITGSIQAPATIPVPPQRPMQATPPAETAQASAPARIPVVQGWSIRDVRNGNVYVEGRGEIFQIVPGAQLPGVGAVETIKRQDGRLVVVTPKGFIVSMRDKGYFER